jgi:hypothetical protein
VPATQLVGAVLGPDHADRRQLSDLVATEPAARPALAIIEPASTIAALLRIVIDDLIDLILRAQLTTGTPVPRLTASLALLALATHQLLRLRTRFRTPLRPRLRWIHRRRPGARARVLTCLLLQSLQPILVLLEPANQIENELNTSLTPRVINRLRIDAIHTRKIRCTKEESLPQAPTTERLPTL